MMIRIIATNQTNIVNHKLSIQQKCSYSCGYHNNISEEVVELSQDISDDPEACSNPGNQLSKILIPLKLDHQLDEINFREV